MDYQAQASVDDSAAGTQRKGSSSLEGIGEILKKQIPQQSTQDPVPEPTQVSPDNLTDASLSKMTSTEGLTNIPDVAPSRRAIPSLPRPQTFHRQESERRDRLLEIPPNPTERRATSSDRLLGVSANAADRPWFPDVTSTTTMPYPSIIDPEHMISDSALANSPEDFTSKFSRSLLDLPPLNIPEPQLGSNIATFFEENEDVEIDRRVLQEECDRRWILNLSMHFRDESRREKFFITFAETPTKWRRVTISIDYRNAPEKSLEADLSTLAYQRDKSFAIYEAIHESLSDIQYYDTVTNLKLETTPEDGQLHIHVREDANEIVKYPSESLFSHISAQRIPESDVEFQSHISGFVYKVQVGSTTVIKKEIPGPDTIDEFLYEVNALDAVQESAHVIKLFGLVTDDSGSMVKGLLIEFSSQGALVDMLYDFRGTQELPWHRREKWAKQIVQGLSDIHEAGFVQGDFTLSNIVIDKSDNASIIDINRRGCPVGWEPPELSRLIESGQRISMCISVKTDLFQLGMVLWALAEEVDDPEHMKRPLPPIVDTVPAYFQQVIDSCLEERPQGRLSAKQLLQLFPSNAGLRPAPSRPAVEFVQNDVRLSDHSMTTHRSDKEYIDPDLAITIDDVNFHHRRRGTDVSHFTSGQVTYVDPNDADQHSNQGSTSYRFGSSGSWIVGNHHRGRSSPSPGDSPSERRPRSPFTRSPLSSTTSLSRSHSPPSRLRPQCSSECTADIDGDGEPALFVRFPNRKLSPAPRVAESRLGDKPLVAPTSLHDNLEKHSSTAVEDNSHRRAAELVHIDSGFDERMAEEFNEKVTEVADVEGQG